MGNAYNTTYDVIGNREDLTDVIVNISPRDTYLLSNLRREKARARYHEWQTATLPTAAASTAVEGLEVTFTSGNARTRVGNYTSLMYKQFGVTSSQMATDTAGVDNEYMYQMRLAMEAHARDIEFNLIQSTSASGTSSAARTMSGFQELITTNVNTSGAESNYTYARHYALAEVISNAGGRPDIMYCKSAVIVDLTAHPTSAGGGSGAVQITAPTGQITDFYDVYKDAFGVKKIVNNVGNYAIPTATASAGVFHIETGRCALAVLDPTKHQRIAPLGFNERGVVYTEATLNWGVQTAHGDAKQLSN